MRYEFTSVKVSREKRYTLGKEIITDKYYLSFPVSPPDHRYVEYEEYYEISFEQFNVFMNSEERLLLFIIDCVRKKNDKLMTFYPRESI